MNGSHDKEAGRMLQLLADRVTEGLDERDAVALQHWLAIHPEVDGDAFERTAAMIALTSVSRCSGRLPGTLRSRLLADGEAFLGGGCGT